MSMWPITEKTSFPPPFRIPEPKTPAKTQNQQRNDVKPESEVRTDLDLSEGSEINYLPKGNKKERAGKGCLNTKDAVGCLDTKDRRLEWRETAHEQRIFCFFRSISFFMRPLLGFLEEEALSLSLEPERRRKKNQKWTASFGR